MAKRYNDDISGFNHAFPMMAPPGRKKGQGAMYGNCYYYSDQDDKPYNPRLFDKTKPIHTIMHYSEEDLRDRTVFGARKEGLFYNYDDRLCSDEWRESHDIAMAVPGTVLKSARYFELRLNHYHKTDNVNLQHVILGCNRSNGYSYLVFGYTYTSTKE